MPYGARVSGWKWLAFLLIGALVLWVGSSKVTAAPAKSRRHDPYRHPRWQTSRNTALHRARRAPRRRAAVARPHRARHAKARLAYHPPATPGVAYRKQSVGSVTAHVVQVDLNRADVQVTVGVANGGIGRCETWSRIIDRLRPTAAITGTYYDPATFIPVGTIIANGIGVHQGTVGTALTFATGNRVRFCRGRLTIAAPELQTALRAGPRLIDQGRVSLMPSIEGFRDPSILVRKARAVVGLTHKNKLLLVTVTKPVYLREMARVMLALGAYNAMCMDGGSSTGLYYAGKSYQVPRRVMTNVLMVYARPRGRKTVGSG
jgi:phosphodiester glycosidase